MFPKQILWFGPDKNNKWVMRLSYIIDNVLVLFLCTMLVLQGYISRFYVTQAVYFTYFSVHIYTIQFISLYLTFVKLSGL